MRWLFGMDGEWRLIDDSGFQHVHLIVSFADLATASEGLDRMFGEPDLTVSLWEAGLISRKPSFGLELFGPSSKVDELVYGLIPQATLHYLEPAGGNLGQGGDLEPDLIPALSDSLDSLGFGGEHLNFIQAAASAE